MNRQKLLINSTRRLAVSLLIVSWLMPVCLNAQTVLTISGEVTKPLIVLADAVDGAPLPQGVGPYRVIVPGEKKPARWIREVKSIEVRYAK